MICSSEQLQKLLKMNVMFGPARFIVENAKVDDVVRQKKMLVKEMCEVDVNFIMFWVNSFEPADRESGVVVEVCEISMAEFEEARSEILSPVQICEPVAIEIMSKMTGIPENKCYDMFFEYRAENGDITDQQRLHCFLDYIRHESFIYFNGERGIKTV